LEVGLFLAVDRNRHFFGCICFGVFGKQALVLVAAGKIEAGRLHAEEAYFAVDQVAGQIQRVFAIEADERGFVDIRVVHFEQRGDAPVNAAAAGVDLFKLAYPFAAFENRIGVADSECQQGFQFADAQVGPQRAGIRRKQGTGRAIMKTLCVLFCETSSRACVGWWRQ
jgi:hypothetical protein